MSNEQTQQAIKDALLQLLEPNADGDALVSAAISLRRIADRMELEPSKLPPKILHR
jgi:hypothetical protein